MFFFVLWIIFSMCATGTEKQENMPPRNERSHSKTNKKRETRKEKQDLQRERDKAAGVEFETWLQGEEAKHETRNKEAVKRDTELARKRYTELALKRYKEQAATRDKVAMKGDIDNAAAMKPQEEGVIKPDKEAMQKRCRELAGKRNLNKVTREEASVRAQQHEQQENESENKSEDSDLLRKADECSGDFGNGMRVSLPDPFNEFQDAFFSMGPFHKDTEMLLDTSGLLPSVPPSPESLGLSWDFSSDESEHHQIEHQISLAEGELSSSVRHCGSEESHGSRGAIDYDVIDIPNDIVTLQIKQNEIKQSYLKNV